MASPGVGSAPPPARYLELRRFWRSFCSCSRRRLSSLTGLGMKPTSQPSFTSRPIHQSLLYFCKQWQVGWERPRGRLEVQASSHPAGETTLGVAYPAQGVAPSKSPTLAPASEDSPNFQDQRPLGPWITLPPAHPCSESPFSPRVRPALERRGEKHTLAPTRAWQAATPLTTAL